MNTARWFLSVLILVGCADEAPEPVDPATRPARVVRVEAVGHQREFSFVGSVRAPQTIDLAFEVDGRLKELPALEGELVEAGGLLARLDTEEFELRVREAEAELALAEQELTRVKSLRSRDLISQAQLDHASTQRDLLELRLLQARETLGDATLTAPSDVRLVRRFVDNHTSVEANTPVLRVMPVDPLDIVAAIPEELVATITAEQVVAITAGFDFDAGRRWPLYVREYAAEASSDTQTYRVRFGLLESPAWNLLPGMTAEVRLIARSESPPQILVPAAALQSTPDGEFYVWVVEDGDHAVSRRLVRAGVPRGKNVTIHAGLEEGEQIVAAGAFALQEGMHVRPVEQDSMF